MFFLCPLVTGERMCYDSHSAITPNLPMLETSIPLRYLVKIWSQLEFRCVLRVILYLWGVRNSFDGNWVVVAILAVMSRYGLLIKYFCTLFLSLFWIKNSFIYLFFVFIFVFYFLLAAMDHHTCLLSQ